MTQLALRQYQVDAIDRTLAAAERGVRKQLGVAATGLGKTIVFASLARRMNVRTLVLAHRDELVSQAVEKIRGQWPEASIGVVKAERNERDADVVVASVQTLSREKRLAQFIGDGRFWGRNLFGLVIVDEAHHARADTYVAILDALGAGKPDGPLLLGVTATPDRGDGRGLDDVFDEVTWTYDILWGIRSGYLCDLRGKRVMIDTLDLAGVRTRNGDYAEGEIGGRMMDAGAPLAIARAWQEHASDRRTLVFTPTVETADAVAFEMSALGVRVGMVSGKTPLDERRQILRDFESGEIQVVANCMVLTEGYDNPRVDCIICARPTKSRALYCFDAATEVLTPFGWVAGRTVNEGDTIAAFDPTDGAVRWEPVLATVERPLLDGERMMELRSPSIDIRVTNTHRMVWRRRAGRSRERTAWQISTAGELAQRADVWDLPAAGIEKATGVPLTHDELRFVAWVQTDGCVNRANWAIQISQSEGPLADEIRRVLTSCGMRWSESVRTEATNFGPRRRPLVVFVVSRGQWRHLRAWLPKVDGSGVWRHLEKMDCEQWAEFLAAWHDGDGSKQAGQSWTRRGYHLAIADEWVAGWVQAMCMRRGWRANVAKQADLWMVHCREGVSRFVGGASSKDRPRLVPSEEVTGELVWCVSVPSGAILTRRNGKGAVVGQTQMVGRGTRRHPDKTDLLVLDVVGVSAEHSLITVPSLFGITDAKQREKLETGEAGAVEVLDEAEAELVRIGAIRAEDVELFHKIRTDIAWVEVHEPGGPRRYQRSMGKDRATGAERPTVRLVQLEVGADRYSCSLRTPTEKGSSVQALIVDVPLETAQAVGEDWIRAQGGLGLVASNAPWRQRDPSPKALSFARQLGIKPTPEIKAGELSDLIDAAKARRKYR